MEENTCVMCGEVIPEGRMVCPCCEEAYKEETDEEWNADDYIKIWEEYDYYNELNRPMGKPMAVALLITMITWCLILGYGGFKIIQFVLAQM